MATVKIPVYQLGPERKWDQCLVRDAVYGRLAAGGHDTRGFKFVDGKPGEWDCAPGVVIAPTGYADDDIPLDLLQEFIGKMDWCVVMAVSDETNYSEVLRDLHHPNMRLWLQTPRPEEDFRHDRFLPIGYSPQATTFEPKPDWERPHVWYFQGQVNHEHRRRMVNQLKRRGRDEGLLITTEGFAQGDPIEYLHRMTMSKFALAPPGPATPDSFRFAEALEMGAVPIVGYDCPAGHEGYWDFLFGDDHPLLVCHSWTHNVNDLIDHNLLRWRELQIKNSAWWQLYKRNLQVRIHEDITEVSGLKPDDEQTTILIPTSPISTHPDTAMLEQTIDSVRFHFPTAEILLMCDGVRQEQEDYRPRYEEYLQRVVWKCEHEWTNVVPLLQTRHAHQVAMTREALRFVRTPTILFVEHDCPLVTDHPFDWNGIFDVVADGAVNVMRFHFESHVLEVHQRLMIDHETIDIQGVPVRRTLQWSQRPHVANSDYYRKLLARPRFDGKNMIEDVAVSFSTTEPWGAHRVAIYHPGEMIKRSYTLDGRGDDPKWPDS